MHNTKKILPLILLVAVFALTIATPVFAQTCDPNDPTCVTDPPPTPTDFVLPSYLELLLAAGVGFLVTNGLKSLGIPLSGYSAQATAGITTALVAFINTLLGFVPAIAQPSVGVIFLLIASILSAFGIHYSVKGKSPKPAG